MRGHRARPTAIASGRDSAVRLRLAAAGSLTALSVAGVAFALAGGQPQSAQATAPSAPAPGPVAPAEAPDQAAAQNLAARVEDVLNSLTAAEPAPNADQLRAAFVSAGAQPASVEVSIDTTPTGLDVDAMTAAASVDEVCVFGHVRDGVVTVTELPVLADGRCFVGDQR